MRDLRELREPSSAEEIEAFETDVLAWFVLARASAGLVDSTIRNDVNHLELVRDWFGRPLREMQPVRSVLDPLCGCGSTLFAVLLPVGHDPALPGALRGHHQDLILHPRPGAAEPLAAAEADRVIGGAGTGAGDAVSARAAPGGHGGLPPTGTSGTAARGTTRTPGPQCHE